MENEFITLTDASTGKQILVNPRQVRFVKTDASSTGFSIIHFGEGLAAVVREPLLQISGILKTMPGAKL